MDGGNSGWRPPSVIFVPLLLCGGFIFYIDVFHLKTFSVNASFKLSAPRFIGYSKTNDLRGFLVKTEACRIPDMDPFDSSVKRYISKPKQFVCNKNKPPLMEANLTYVYMLNDSLSSYLVKDLSALKCCYSPFYRVEPSSTQGDTKISYNKCVQFNQSAKVEDDFIRVACTYEKKEIYKDFFSFVPIKPRITKFSTEPKKLNVLIIGLDAVSRLNFHRQMPNTVKTLKNMGAVELLGYNKVGDNTFPNLVPVLTGLHESELKKDCWPKKTDKFDKCNFIWKNYSASGYATAFGEDATWMGIFNYVKRGFKQQPTDYFWGPFDYASEKQIGNAHDMNVNQCIGSRAVYKVLLDYIMKFVNTMTQRQIPYFGFFWGASLSHDYLNKPHLGDDSYTDFFNQLEQSDFLKNTVLIFMSDHGIRWGDIRSTYQGRMEERLPFLFIVLPKDYRDNFPQTVANMNRNVNRLTTPFDLHETLKDLLNPYSLQNVFINERIGKRSGKERSYSLFEPIPTNRTCEKAGISSHWCTCQASASISKNDSVVIDATKFVVNYLNNQLKGYAECANLTLAEIYDARIHAVKDNLKGNTYSEDYTVVFRTVPGDGKFEATIRRYVSKKGKKTHFDVMGTVSRINLYGSQSLCMTDFHLKLYCYCIT
ncbi:uncharacterized protein LOC116176732 isoform X2 [Photinus pyralis]|nr:uncharacterized protein LOC116176732 isoform X2 [Photinus pyralis]